MILSICIPTYNRIEQLDNCLNSILIAKKNQKSFQFEVCISDNDSKEKTLLVIEKYKNDLDIKFNKNIENLGFALNAIKTVSMAKGEYAWLIGNDDLILPETFNYLNNLFKENNDKDYFFINSCHLNSSYLNKFSKPFDTNHLTALQMKSISKLRRNRSVNFWEVIDPEVSWEFLIGIFVSIFRTKKWMNNVEKVNRNKITDKGTWSTFENTCLHPIILAEAFSNSKAYVCSKPLSVNLFGEREWGDLYEFIEIIRIPELLDFYRKKGLPYQKYFYNKNFALRNFSSYLVKIIIGGKKKGLNYISLKKHILPNLIFPNVYLSFFTIIFKKIKQTINFRKK